MQYLHRTVKYFIEQPDTWEWLTDQCQTWFDHQVSLCRVRLLEAKSTIPETHYGIMNFSYTASCLDRSLRHASLATTGSRSILVPILGEMNKVVAETLRELEQTPNLYMQQRLRGILSQVDLLLCCGSPPVSPTAHEPGQERAFPDEASGEKPAVEISQPVAIMVIEPPLHFYIRQGARGLHVNTKFRCSSNRITEP